jgi:hypothetical protein
VSPTPVWFDNGQAMMKVTPKEDGTVVLKIGMQTWDMTQTETWEAARAFIAAWHQVRVRDREE